MKMDDVCLEIALADGAYACHELNSAVATSTDGGFSCAARIEGLMREMRLLLKDQALPATGVREIDLKAVYLAAAAGSLRLTAIVADHSG